MFFNLCPFSVGTSVKRLTASSSFPLIRLFIDEISLKHLFSMLNSSIFLSLSCCETSSIPWINFVALLWTHSSKFISALYWEALDSVLQIWPHQLWVDPPPAGSTFPNAAVEAADFFATPHFLPQGQPCCLLWLRGPCLLCQLCVSSSAPSMNWSTALFLPRGKTLLFSLLNFQRLISSNVSNLFWQHTNLDYQPASEFCIIFELFEGAPCPTTQVIKEA